MTEKIRDCNVFLTSEDILYFEDAMKNFRIGYGNFGQPWIAGQYQGDRSKQLHESGVIQDFVDLNTGRISDGNGDCNFVHEKLLTYFRHQTNWTSENNLPTNLP